MTEKDQRLALSYWEGYRWVRVTRKSVIGESAATFVHYVEPRAMASSLRVASGQIVVLEGHPDPTEPGLGDEWRNSPIYASSLDDCFRVQTKLSHAQGGDYYAMVRQVLNDLNRERSYWMGPTPFDLLNVNAAVRFEALLRTLNLWTTTT